MRGNIKPFNSTEQYILATKQENKISILPKLDGSKLVNLPYAHEHLNSEVLERLKQDSEGNLVYNNKTLQEIVSDPVPDYDFNSNDIVNNLLTINTTIPIADILFYTNESKIEMAMVHLPFSVNKTSTKIYFNQVNEEDYQYGGVVRFAKGISSTSNADLFCKASNVEGAIALDASKGQIYQIFDLTGDLYINSVNILNLQDNQVMKIFVNNTGSEYDIYINNKLVPYKVFFCTFINFNGTIMFFDSIVELL